MIFLDKLNFDSKNIKRTDEGFMIIPAYIARTGVQAYLPEEGGNLHRPAEEVFSEDSIETMRGKSITKLHPRDENNNPTTVNPNNWKMYEVGTVISKPVAEGKYLKSELMIKDAKMISEIEEKSAKHEALELSCGYSADIELADGVNEEGESYQGIMRNIRYNHLSIVPRGRAGSEVKMLLDHFTDTKENIKMAKVMFRDAMLEIADADAQKFNDMVKGFEKEIDESKAKLDAAIAEKAQLEEKIKNMFDAEAIESMAKELSEVREICDGLKIEGKVKLADMKDAIVERMLPEVKEAYSKGSEDYKKAMFDCAVPMAKKHIETNKNQFKATDAADNINDESKLFA